ncbi:MAG TPA: histidine phosphatase family protein [Chloroflexia bacterium]|nr:histidine phosphatase family protein [Chloroflexia bacterium]
MTNLYLIRHGEGMFAVHGRLADLRGAAGMSPHGVAQAERLRARLAATGEIRPDVLIASSLPRAQETAAILAPALGGLPVRLDDDLHEMRYGEADGMLLTEYEARFGVPDVYREPWRPLAPGGEHWVGFVARISAALARITHDHAGQTIVLVCHGGVIEAAFLYFLGLDAAAGAWAGLFPQNTSITHWVQQAWPAGRWQLQRYNDHLHLRDDVRWGAG